MTNEDYARLKSIFAGVTFSYTNKKSLTPGSVVLSKNRDGLDWNLRRVLAIDNGMVAFDDGKIESFQEDIGPVMILVEIAETTR